MADEQSTPDTSSSGSSGSSGSAGDGGKAKGGNAPAAPPVKFGDVVEFTRHDPILGHVQTGVGVVEDVDDQGVTIAPLAHHSVRAALADVKLYAAGES